MDDIPIPTTRQVFDQQPIGNTNKLNIDQYPPDFDPSKIQAKAQPLPIGKRLASKVFKIKKQALEELLKIVTNENHKQFCEHQSKIIQTLSDSNPQCQILAAKVLLQYLEKEGVYEDVVKEQAKKSFPKMVIEKVLIIEREQAQNVGMDILFWLMDHRHQDFLLRQLNEYLLNKNPKIVAVTFRILQSLVSNYGPKKLGDLELFFKNFKLLSEPVKPTAKQQMVQLFQELFKWMGDNVFTSFVFHKDCKDEVMKWSKTYEKQPMEIKRGLKKGQVTKRVIPNEEDEEQDNTPVDVLTPYDSKWVDTILAMEKWQQKKDHLDDFIKKTNVRVIVPRDNTHYITLLKRLFQDNNINLLLCGFKIVKNLSRGLKKAFSITCKTILPYIYLRLKDNKALIVDETLATLKAMTASITFEDLEKEIVEAFKDKSPQMRLNTLKLLKEVSGKREPKTSKILKSMISTLVSLTNDSSSDVRDIALSVLCKIKQFYGMVFFEDKLESLPAKKLGVIRATPSAGIPEHELKAEMEQNSASISFQKSNSNTSQASTRNNPQSNRENKMIQDSKTIQNQKKKPEPQMTTNKIQPRNQQKSLDKKTSYTMDTKQKNNQREMANLPLPTISEENQYHSNSKNSVERQMMQIREEEWPIVPKKQHVRRLIILFDKLGQPFATLATPFRLTVKDLEVLENADTSFMIDNADLLLKWALWKIQTENQEVIDKITSVVIHLIYLLKTKMTDSLTILIMSIISNLLESEFTKIDMLQCINTSIMEISVFLREKVFNFWLTTLNQSSNNPEFCDKILILLQRTFTTIDIDNNECIAMARVEPITKSKFFMAFLQTKKPREYLKISGFKFIDDFRPESQWLLRLSEMDFAIDMRVEERIYFFGIFGKMSHEATEEFIKIEDTCPSSEIINVHLKIMDSVMLAFLDQSLPSINMHNYLSRLTGTLTSLNEEFIIPELRNLLRFVMFFLVDVNSSRLEDKDQITKATNKIILIILDKVAADHLLETMGTLLKYCYKHNLTKKLSQLLTKCMTRTTKNASFGNKALKNVKSTFNFIISFIEEFKVQDSDPIIKNFVEMFTNMMSLYKELCYQNVIEKLQYFDRAYGGSFASQIILDIFNRFMNKPEQAQKQEEAQVGNNVVQNNGINNKVDARVMENNSFMSNLPQNYQIQNNQQSQPIFFPQPNIAIRESTNIPRKDVQVKQMKQVPNSNVELLVNQGPKIRQDRRRIQNYTGLCQSFIELTRMQDQFSVSTTANNNEQPTVGQNSEKEQNI